MPRAGEKRVKREWSSSPDPSVVDLDQEDTDQEDIWMKYDVVESDPAATPGKKPRVFIKLTDEEEEDMVEFVKENECLYNKKLRAWTDKNLKSKVWCKQALLMGKTEGEVKQWFHSIRTRYGKLRKLKSGQPDLQLSERDKWIYERFGFLGPHIVEVQRRSTSSLKAKAAAAGVVEFTSSTTDVAHLPSTSDMNLAENLSLDMELPAVVEPTPIILNTTPVVPVSTSTLTVGSHTRAVNNCASCEPSGSSLDDRADRILSSMEQLLSEKQESLSVDQSERVKFISWVADILKNLPKPVYREARRKMQDLMNDCLDKAEDMATT